MILDTIRTVSTFAISNQVAFMEKVLPEVRTMELPALEDYLIQKLSGQD